ncbi:E3 ubiquitin-protein ligase MARCHF4 [Halyomorpha halys]|uniref:E3 ubiquitin-protein ligase MARCHF4 n=1 Tax=Halyomorpha halys TaxID=286706 RepID=UPI0006D4F21D|nr:E3 ubiquitin-protein ligase MARCH4-like [Halyomorpha halys]
MESQIDTESIDVPTAEAASENTESDLRHALSSKTQERQMTPTDCCCRICYQRNISEPNLSLCGCRGTLELVHKSCLELWLASSHQAYCELCGYRFNLRKKLKYGLFKAILVWLKLKRSREDKIAIVMDIFKLSAALAMLFVINYQTMTLLGRIQRLDMSLQDFVNPFLEQDQNWSDLADVGNTIFKLFTLAVATPMTLDYIGNKMHNLDIHISQWYRWYESQVVIELIPA